MNELVPTAEVLAQVLPLDAMVINNMGEAGRCYLHPIEHPASVSLPVRCNVGSVLIR